MHRRTFLKTMGLTGLSLGGASFSTNAKSDRRPNILFAIADDQSWLHTGRAGDTVVKTPTFDRIAAEGAYCEQAYCSAPSCTPSRGAILTGQDFWRLEEGANLWSDLPAHFQTYPEMLAQAGYHVGHTRKGWGPGNLKGSGRKVNPAGPSYKDFGAFLEKRDPDQPFCFWFGSFDPHRPYKKGSGIEAGLDPEAVDVPPFLPDAPEVRSDILDYYLEVQRFDHEVGLLLKQLAAAGELDNTLIIMTSDNGMPFPRAKTTLYDSGAHMPLAIRFPEAIAPGTVVEEFISFTDFAPTFLALAGVEAPEAMTGNNLMPCLRREAGGCVGRDQVFFGRERHCEIREGGVGYPSRAIRTADFLYIRNFAPDRWPAGDPGIYCDIDGESPSKTYLLDHAEDPEVRPLFEAATAKRPAEELYDLKQDPSQLKNVAGEAAYAEAQARLWKTLRAYLEKTGDPRIGDQGSAFDRYPYYGMRPAWADKENRERP